MTLTAENYAQRPAERIHEFMLAPVAFAPERAAVVESDGVGGLITTTYRELADRVDRYAAALLDLGLDIGDRVILESDTSGHAIALLLACSKAGVAFIPVSPETPDKRLHSIISTTAPALHLQSPTGVRQGIPAEVGTARFGPNTLAVERPPVARVRHRREASATDPAYMIFTSGTTGRPKGVVMSHRGVVAFYRGMLSAGIVGTGDRVATTSPLQFDFSLLDIGLALGSGATVVPVPRAALPWPRRFLAFLNEAEVTQVNGVPSIWRGVLRHELAGLAELEKLRGVLFCGEDFPLPELRLLQRARPNARLVNCYGATESMAASFTDVPNPLPDELEKLSIGFAYPGAEMTIVDEDQQPITEPGVVGHIHLRAPSLFTGYWDDPEATRAAQVPDPLNPKSGQLVLRTGDLAYQGPDGELYFCGRADNQVQIRGNRVELGEVERRILEFPGITAAAALVLPRADKEPVLGAFVVTAKDAEQISENEIRAFCKETLPAYMTPHELRVVESLPVTPNGKIDRKVLAASVT